MTGPENLIPAIHRELRAQLNSETAKLAWPELQRHFARGVVVVVKKELDLIDVAVSFATDDKPQAARWIESGNIWQATDSDARRWLADNVVFWAVVVAPWVLIQEVTEKA